MTDEEKHAFARKIGYPHAVFLPRSLYLKAERAGYDMSVYVMVKPIPMTKTPPRKRISEKTCNGKEAACLAGKGGVCVACADDD
jgi:hypothetical protein